MQCDFCSAPSPTWAFFARPFIAWEVRSFAGASDSGRAACDICYKLILEGDRKGLQQQAFESLLFIHPEIQMMETEAVLELKSRLGSLQTQFFDNKLLAPPIRLV